MTLLFRGRIPLSQARQYRDRVALRQALYDDTCVTHAISCLERVWGYESRAPDIMHFLEAYEYAVFGDEGGALRAKSTAALEAFETALLAMGLGNGAAEAAAAAFRALFGEYTALL